MISLVYQTGKMISIIYAGKAKVSPAFFLSVKIDQSEIRATLFVKFVNLIK